MRLDKFIGKSTEYSLADAKICIEDRRVAVNGDIVIVASHQVHKNNVVALDGSVLTLRPFRYLLLNKPAGMICSNIDEKYPSALNLLDIDKVEELHIAGRLDADTTGLVLITDDGHWSFNLTLPQNKCAKIYQVALSQPLSPDVAERFLQGILLQGESTLTQPAILHIINPLNVLLTLTEGRYHQVKRMFSAMGNRVLSLHRQQIGGIKLDVDIGHWRYLSIAEVKALSVNDNDYFGSS